MTDPRSAAAEILRRVTDRPLGDILLKSNLSERPFYSALQESADNLLQKACRALAAGDEEKVEKYVRRALALPYDEAEEADTALFSAGMAVFEVVTDLVDEADEGDPRWLDAAERTLDTCPDGVRDWLHRSLAVVQKDYRLPRAEDRRLRAALNRHPAPGPAPDDVPRDGMLDDDERARLVRNALQAVVAIGQAYDGLARSAG